ncbi:MAG: ribbon-helix-helix domain-containing protein [Rhodospirillales bacterium]|tara:strand:- start:414 stop:692 length:279 start_codon:yes stop_codon:yes gene_type:complete
MQSKLISRNVTVNGRRTSLRLENATWDALDQICECEKISVHELCSMIESVRFGSSRTSTVRAFIVTYFRLAANRTGIEVGIADKALTAFKTP